MGNESFAKRILIIVKTFIYLQKLCIWFSTMWCSLISTFTYLLTYLSTYSVINHFGCVGKNYACRLDVFSDPLSLCPFLTSLTLSLFCLGFRGTFFGIRFRGTLRGRHRGTLRGVEGRAPCWWQLLVDENIFKWRVVSGMKKISKPSYLDLTVGEKVGEKVG